MRANSSNIKLLLVDDEEEFLMSSSKALNRRGFDVSVALNGVTALEILEKNEFDAIILDVRMPDIDGLEVFRQIRRMRPEMPAILLTGHTSTEDAFQASRDGIADYLSKPIDMDELARSIHKAIERTRKRLEENNRADGPTGFEEIIRVMLIDDEADFLDAMKRILQRRGMDVTTAQSGEEALALLKESIVDIGILDIKMPGMDGLEVLRRIKKGFPSVEVILLTGHPSIESATQGIKLGASEYIKKPPDVNELVATIRKLYRDRQEAILEQQKKLIEEIRRRYPE